MKYMYIHVGVTYVQGNLIKEYALHSIFLSVAA